MSNNHKSRRTATQSAEADAELRRRLEEAEQTLEAIRHGDVDGLVVAGPQGEHVYSLAGAEHVYRVIVETMNEAALTVDANGTILYCNRRFCDLMKTSIQGAMGRKVTAFAAPPQQFLLQRLLADAQMAPLQRRLLLRAVDGTPVPVQLAASPLEAGDSPSICLVASDLTELEASAGSIRVLREYQAALEKSEHQYRELVRCDPAGIYEIDYRGPRFLSVNDAMCQLTGYSREELLAMNPFDLLDRDSQARFQARIDRCLQGEQPLQNVEYRVKTKDGRTLDVLQEAAFTTDEQGRPLGATVVAHDITERKKAAEALRNAYEDLQVRAEQLQTVNDMLQAKQQELEQANESLQAQEQDLRQHAEELQTGRERLALAASGTRIGMYEWNVVTGETLWTEQVARLLGLRTTTISLLYHYQDWAERVHPEDLPRVEAERRRCLAEQAPYEAEYRVVWPDGNVHWLADRGVFQYDSEGCCQRMLGMLLDITDRKQAEDTLRAKEAELQLIADATPVLLTRISRDLRYVFVNHACAGMLGRQPEEIVGKPVVEIIGKQAFETIRPYFERVLQGERVEYETEIPYQEPGPRFMHVTYIPERNGRGDVVGWLASILDITNRRQAEEALKVKDRAITTSLNAIAMANPQGRLTYVNPAFLKLWGYEEEGEVLGKSVLDFWREPRKASEVMQAIRNGEGWMGELVAIRKDGACLSLYVSAGAVLNEAGTPVCVMASFVDLTERKQMEEALRELNATLESEVAARTAELEHRARQLQKLTLELTQAEERERRRIALVFHLNDLREVLQWLAHRVQTQQGLTVRVDIADAAAEQSEALTMFLFRAAREMLFNVVQHAGVNEAALRVRRRGHYICLRIADRGCGFDPRALRATAGFGLLSIRERVELLGGRMKIKSIKGQGSTFAIVVPDGAPEEKNVRR